MSRSDYHKLKTYNTHFKGEISGPRVPANTPSMKIQTPLYPRQKTGYNALTFNGNDREYYKIGYGPGSRGSGPYGLECSVNRERSCKGGNPIPPFGPGPYIPPIENYESEDAPMCYELENLIPVSKCGPNQDSPCKWHPSCPNGNPPCDKRMLQQPYQSGPSGYLTKYAIDPSTFCLQGPNSPSGCPLPPKNGGLPGANKCHHN